MRRPCERLCRNSFGFRVPYGLGSVTTAEAAAFSISNNIGENQKEATATVRQQETASHSHKGSGGPKADA